MHFREGQYCLHVELIHSQRRQYCIIVYGEFVVNIPYNLVLMHFHVRVLEMIFSLYICYGIKSNCGWIMWFLWRISILQLGQILRYAWYFVEHMHFLGNSNNSMICLVGFVLRWTKVNFWVSFAGSICIKENTN